MLLARMISPIHSLGPGERVGIWLQGCSKQCKGCISPEMQFPDSRKNVPVEMLTTIIKEEAVRNNCNGLTISGGDPLEQAGELCVLLTNLRPIFSDILVYTGFTMHEIIESNKMSSCLEYIDVLVDGRYEEEFNYGESRICGSNNQKIFFLNKNLVNDYKEYDCNNHSLESFIHKGKVITVGIQRRVDYEVK